MANDVLISRSVATDKARAVACMPVSRISRWSWRWRRTMMAVKNQQRDNRDQEERDQMPTDAERSTRDRRQHNRAWLRGPSTGALTCTQTDNSSRRLAVREARDDCPFIESCR